MENYRNKNDKMNGLGTYTWSSGDKFIGEYKNDKRWNGTYYMKSGSIYGRWVNGVKQP